MSGTTTCARVAHLRTPQGKHCLYSLLRGTRPAVNRLFSNHLSSGQLTRNRFRCSFSPSVNRFLSHEAAGHWSTSPQQHVWQHPTFTNTMVFYRLYNVNTCLLSLHFSGSILTHNKKVSHMHSVSLRPASEGARVS